MKNLIIRWDNQKRKDNFTKYQDLTKEYMNSKAFDKAIEDAILWNTKGKEALNNLRALQNIVGNNIKNNNRDFSED